MSAQQMVKKSTAKRQRNPCNLTEEELATDQKIKEALNAMATGQNLTNETAREHFAKIGVYCREQLERIREKKTNPQKDVNMDHDDTDTE